MLALTLSFFAIALVYSMVGFGGGSSYIAILAAAGTPFHLIPKLSLLCNLLVVVGGCYHYMKNGHFSWPLIIPFVLGSVPMTYLGGLFPLKEQTFFLLLTVSLILCGLRILFLPDRKPSQVNPPCFSTSCFVGAVLGMLSGMVGIGGGIFLSPFLVYMGWARSKEAAAVASAFICLNSLSGLAGQFTKNPSFSELWAYLPLFVSVIVAGQIGSRIGAHKKVSFAFVQKGTGILTLFISLKLLLRALS